MPTDVPDRARPLAADEDFSYADALGGPLGIVESGLPAVAFVATYTITGQQLGPAAMVAVGIGAAMAVLRIVRRESVQYALAGLVGVAFAAFIASRTGRAEDFFLPGILTNAAFALAYGISIAAGRPLLGYIVAPLRGEREWRADPARVRAYARASWVWVGVFSTRLLVQVPLYLSGAVVALGAARVALGLPLFALGIWISWLLLRTPPPRTA